MSILTKKEIQQVVRYCSVIISIVANITFIIILLSSYCPPGQPEQEEIRQANVEIIHDTLSELFSLLEQTDRWFISSAMYTDFSERCYVKISINGNNLLIDILKKDISEEVKKIINILK